MCINKQRESDLSFCSRLISPVNWRLHWLNGLGSTHNRNKFSPPIFCFVFYCIDLVFVICIVAKKAIKKLK